MTIVLQRVQKVKSGWRLRFTHGRGAAITTVKGGGKTLQEAIRNGAVIARRNLKALEDFNASQLKPTTEVTNAETE